MGFTGALLGGLKGYDRAAGATGAAEDVQAQQEQAKQQKMQKIQMQLAPLHLASVGLQSQLAPLIDPETGKPREGYEDRYNEIHDQLADVIGKQRALLLPPPKEDPHGLGYLMHRATDKAHITKHAVEEARKANSDKVNAYYQQGQNEVAQTVQGIQPNPLDPEEQYNAARVKANLDPKAAAPPKAAPETSDTRARGDFADFKKTNPDYRGTFEQWKTEQAGAGRNAVKQPNRDDRYIAIQQKKAGGKPLTDDEKSYSAAYDLWTKKTKVDPGVARAAAFSALRYIPVVDPNNPEQVVMMHAADAAKAGVGTPASIAFQTDKALTRAFTSGQPAQTINYFNTATEHLQQLQQAADALQNGDVQMFNKWSNAWATATGNPAPTNFATVRNAVAGELSKTFKGSAATDAEIDAINTSINSSQSPAQLSGAIGNNINLMGSKMGALRGQYEQGKQGKPNFPEGPKTKELRSAQKPQGAVGTVTYQGKKYWVDKDKNNLGVAP